ncbi:hypothetical protein GCM10022270_12930 [Terriglobus aquaticus]
MLRLNEEADGKRRRLHVCATNFDAVKIFNPDARPAVVSDHSLSLAGQRIKGKRLE